MKLSDVMGHAGLAIYAEVAMILFLFAFAIILWRVFAPANRRAMEEAGRLPLDDGGPVPPGRSRS